MTQKDKSTPDRIQNPISVLHPDRDKERRAGLLLEPTMLKFCELMTGCLRALAGLRDEKWPSPQRSSGCGVCVYNSWRFP